MRRSSLKVLLVEDELTKEKKLMNHICTIHPHVSLDIKHSITTAIIALRQNEYNYVVLDMSLPLYDFDDMEHSEDNEFDAFGGMSVLDEIDRLFKVCKVIVVTAFDKLGEGKKQIELPQIQSELEESFPENYVGCIFYDSSRIDWQSELNSYLGGITTDANTDCG